MRISAGSTRATLTERPSQCTPPKVTDFLAFYVANYAAHAATLLSRPGESFASITLSALCALFIPSSGSLRTIRYLLLMPIRGKDELDKAARSEALCTIFRKYKATGARGDWYDKIFAERYLETAGRESKVQGLSFPHNIPENYYLALIPRDTPLRGINGRDRKRIHLAHSYNVPKVLVGLFQAIWGAVGLYKARGDQLQRYGYAAFGLSVAPFVFMSVVNITVALITPEYPVKFLVWNPDMTDEAVKGCFDNTIAEIDVDAKPSKRVEEFFAANDWRYWVLVLTFMLAPIAIVGGLSRFQPGESSLSERAWMMSWLVVGTVSSAWVRLIHVSYTDDAWSLSTAFKAASFVLPLWIPALGGMVTVGKMIQDYGACTRLDLATG
jgi:hypothetical protein